MTSTVQRMVLSELDEMSLSRYHWRIIFTAGMGFFTDAYDLFIIGVVTAILAPLWHLSTSQIALLNGGSLAAAAFGAVFFGTLADKFGRKRLYGLEVFILFIGALLSASATSFTWLFLSRILVGLGIGGDYPTSAVVVSENATRSRRGFLVLFVFAMQAVGLIFGPLFASLLLATHMAPDYVWRILLALGAIPAASVFYLRRTIHESPRYLLSKQVPIEVSRVVADLTTGEEIHIEPLKPKHRLLSKKWLKCLVGTAGAWFLLDVAFYGNGISSVMIIKSLNPDANLLNHTLISALIFLVFAVPGYFLAAKYVDRIGRKPLQYAGFAVMALTYSLIAFVPSITDILPLFVAIFGLSFFFINFGPNSTTFLIPSEIYPTVIRARAHGISAAIGKVGAFVGAFILPFVLTSFGLEVTMILMAIVSILGILVTLLIPEMKNISLDAVDKFQTSS